VARKKIMSDLQEERDANDVAEMQERAEADARRQGWRPQEEYAGNPKHWVDAETFLERGKEIRTFTKKENEQLRRELAEAKRVAEEQGKTIEEIREYHAGMEKRAIESAITRLRAEKKQALAEGNLALASELDEDIDELREAPSAVPVKKPAEKKDDTTTAVEMPPEVKKWHADNAAWYNTEEENEDLVAYADGMAKKIGTIPNLSIDDRLEMLTERVKKAFPDRFTPRKRVAVTSGSGEGGGRDGSRKSSKSVAALPADARAAGERFVRQKLYKDLQEYADEYFSQSGV
jgi:hypothetical protein